MPAAEAAYADAPEMEHNSYEFAFHVLPTVAEGEVADVFGALKALITTAGGVVTTEEAPQRFDLAYDIVKYLEGKNRKFSSAHFGWIRFTLEPAALEKLTEQIDSDKRLLRYLVIRLTKAEEAQPFRFHESIDHKRTRTVVEEEVVESTDDTSEADSDETIVSEAAGDDDIDETLTKSDA